MNANQESNNSKQETDNPSLSGASQSINETKRAQRYTHYKLQTARICAAVVRCVRDIFAPFSVMDSVGYFTAVLAVIAGLTAVILWETDQTARGINRAFLSSYEIQIAKSGDGDSAIWGITPILENAGNTSAIDVRSRIMRIYFTPLWQMRRVDVEGIDPDTMEVEFDGLPAASLSLAPHSKTSLGTIVFTDLARGMIKLKTLNAFLFGEAEYFDVFGKWHRTKFCYRLTGSTISISDDTFGQASNVGAFWAFVPGRIEVARNDMGYRLCRRNNCIDDQCGARKKRPDSDHPNLNVIARYPSNPNRAGNKLLDIEVK